MVKSPRIQAIETTYNGILFRSRLEARWAVFMDCLSIRYEYEPEGYTDGVTRYLVDFYLPDLDCYVEIKPSHEMFRERERAKVKMLADGSGKPVYVFCGNCEPPPEISMLVDNENCAFAFNTPRITEHSRRDYETQAVFCFTCCLQCKSIDIIPGAWYPEYCRCDERGLIDHHRSPQILAAFAVANSIRFDHEAAKFLTAKDSVNSWVYVWTEGFSRLLNSVDTCVFLKHEAAHAWKSRVDRHEEQ